MSDARQAILEIQEAELEFAKAREKVLQLRRSVEGRAVKDYKFGTSDGSVRLSELFGDKSDLIVIHNMGKKCVYCTLWADGLNGFVPHMESVMSVALVSKDSPEIQRQFANSRGWRFNLASHGGGDYIQEQTVMKGADNMPGAVLYVRQGEKIIRKNSAVFGPGDQYCSIWNLFGMAGINISTFSPAV